MIKVTVPTIKPEDVERVQASMAALTSTMRAYAPLFATVLVQMGQQVAVATRAFRTSLEAEVRRQEEARRGKK